MSPSDEALAFRIWQYAEPLGWDCGVKEVADHLGSNWQRVRSIAVKKGWASRFRVSDQYAICRSSNLSSEVYFHTRREVENMRATMKVLGDD